MKVSKGVRSLALVTAAVIGVACGENLNGGLACPTLCPNPPAQMRDTTFDAVIMDTSIAGFPTTGAELSFYVATLGDTLETAAIIRFDSLPKVFRGTNASEDSAIVFIDTGSYLRVFITRDTTLDSTALADSTTIELYNVDLGGAEDSVPTAVTTAFTPDRLLATRTVMVDSLRDSLRIPLDPNFILDRINDPASRIRLGIRVAQRGVPKVTILSTNANSAPTIIFRPSLDTLVKMFVEPMSKAPPDLFVASDFADYLVSIRTPPEPPPGVFRIGGLPPRRAYLRFSIPKSILDSSSVVRATLFLTQRPSASPEPTDTIGVGHFGVTSGGSVIDLNRALFFLQRLSNFDTVFVTPADSMERSFEVIDWVRAWRNTDSLKTPRAIALATSEEGESGQTVDFFSIEAPVGVRPRLRLTFIPRSAGPLP